MHHKQPIGLGANFSELLTFIRLFYNHEAANELQFLAHSDPIGAYELALVALHPDALAMKYKVDADERKILAG